MSRPRRVVVTRATLDWSRATRSDLRDDRIRAAVDLWDRAFARDFMWCRHEIKRYAQACLARLPNVDLTDPAGLRLPGRDTPVLVLICDDDDWYHPDLFSYLEGAVRGSEMGVIWPDGVYGYHVRWQAAGTTVDARLEAHLTDAKARTLGDRTAFSAIKTNNYALTARYFERHDLDDALSHARAAETLSATLEGGCLEALDQPLSVANRHPCSYLVMTAVNESADGDPGRLVRLVSDYVAAPVDLRPDFRWAAPHVARMKAIFAEVLRSRR